MLLLGLVGCASDPVKDPDEKPPVTPQEVPEEKPGVSMALPPSEFAAQFSAAERALAKFDWMEAEVTLAQLPSEEPTAEAAPTETTQPQGSTVPFGASAGPVPEAPRKELSPDDIAYLAYLRARIDYVRGRQQQAMQALTVLDSPGVHPALRYRALNFRRHMLAMQGDHLASARVGDQLLRMAPTADDAAKKRAIWRNLQRADTSDLQAALASATDPRWRAWLELAVIGAGDRNQAVLELPEWLARNPEHPAATLPGGLGYLLESSADPGTVALLLPLSGRLAPAGKAVMDGYMASYYAARESGVAPRNLLILDLENYDSPLTAYNEALGQGASLIIGPLSKNDVGTLGQRIDRPVPVLALNRLDQPLPTSSSALVQLSLAPTDEAGRIAELAFGEGRRSALVIRPAGAWGDRMDKALSERWKNLGGRVAGRVRYAGQEEYSADLKTGLDLQASEKRARDVRSMLATNIEFTARRRQDLDVVFLLSRNSAQARSIKPLLAFHYAGNLPVYATSSVYSGIPDDRDRDLDGINLVETPWLLGANPGLRVAIAAGGTGSDNYTRLNALGADAFLLQTRFSQLQGGPDALVRGNTGLLSLDPQLRIRRELSPATFDGGALKPR
jgi:outer membrane PBP1 activator LpoA protein